MPYETYLSKLVNCCYTIVEVSGRELEVVITQEYKSLIEEMVVANKRFVGNEDLFEDFCAEALERSMFLVNRANEVKQVKNYLSRIISTAIISVLKSSGRITRTAEGYSKVLQTSLTTENPLDDGLWDIKDPAINFVETITEKETLQEIYEIVSEVDMENSQEEFYKIFYMKYIQGKKQREIAAALGISQGEVSKRLFVLMKKINEQIHRF